MNAPVTFGQVFKAGDVKSTEYLGAKTAAGTTVPIQVDVKARHADGSLRHAIITVVLPTSLPAQTQAIYLVKGTAPGATAAATPQQLLNAGFTSSFSATIGGKVYTASADALLKSGKFTTWMSGPLATEWQVSAPLQTASGEVHPHLSARFAIRAYGTSKARVDVTVENAWAFEAKPQNFTYDAQVLIGGRASYTKAGMTHYHHARWRQVAWWGTAPALQVSHNPAYLIASKAVPNYDQTVKVQTTALTDLKTTLNKTLTQAMPTGLVSTYMPMTGGRIDIGILPGWAAMTVLSTSSVARDLTLSTGDLAGSWSIHYRDRRTDRPVTLADYPYMTIVGRSTDTYNPATKQYEAFPACAGAGLCDIPTTADTAHQPSLAYLPYVLTGDYYYLEELQFWANFDSFSENPNYRSFGKGLVQNDQVRGQAWSMRTLGQAAYITPDSDPQKAVLTNLVNNNLNWYETTYVNNSQANKLGVLINGYAFSYNNGTAIAPWQDDFFTSVAGHLSELGFTKAQALLAWKAQFAVSRMVGAGACWIDGAIYNVTLKNSSTDTAIYSTIADVYKASHTPEIAALTCNSTQMAAAFGVQVGEMTGVSSFNMGYPSNMQPALAFAAPLTTDGAKAWKLFMSRTVKPDYSTAPQFAIVPR
ncbi:hypothetical protein GM668_10765 [Duganella ginsengisoli]|uniref:Uncharacterized protein n=1 Tax=Pseudoduganella ginsengisoli TaxID=1462440 RepID=A0A6L6Q0K1_9BURK|nr:hypothetical protein [Pseudoduganella ginsengisoli]